MKFINLFRDKYKSNYMRFDKKIKIFINKLFIVIKII